MGELCIAITNLFVLVRCFILFSLVLRSCALRLLISLFSSAVVHPFCAKALTSVRALQQPCMIVLSNHATRVITCKTVAQPECSRIASVSGPRRMTFTERIRYWLSISIISSVIFYCAFLYLFYFKSQIQAGRKKLPQARHRSLQRLRMLEV
jgi:hypothetical protein